MFYLNSQKYSECQVVTAINAAVFLGFSPVDPNSSEYERLVDLAFARNGAAIRVDKVHEYLKICHDPIEPTWENIAKAINQGHPVEVSVWHTETGFHSVLVVDTECKATRKYLKVLNFKCITTADGWVSWKRFRAHIKSMNNPHNCRLFYVNPIYRVSRWYDVREEN